MTFQYCGRIQYLLSHSFSSTICFGIYVKLCDLDALQTFHCYLSLAGDYICCGLAFELIVDFCSHRCKTSQRH